MLAAVLVLHAQLVAFLLALCRIYRGVNQACQALVRATSLAKQVGVLAAWCWKIHGVAVQLSHASLYLLLVWHGRHNNLFEHRLLWAAGAYLISLVVARVFPSHSPNCRAQTATAVAFLASVMLGVDVGACLCMPILCGLPEIFLWWPAGDHSKTRRASEAWLKSLLAELREWIQKHGDVMPPHGSALGNKVDHLRKTKDTIPADLKAELDILLDQLDTGDTLYEDLHAYLEANEGVYPNRCEGASQETCRLAKKLSQVKSRYRANKLSQDRIKLLESLRGWSYGWWKEGPRNEH